MLSEISQSEKDKYHVISHTRGISETKQISKGKKKRQTKKQTHNHSEQMVSRGEVGEGDG